MNLQLALDRLSREECLHILKQTAEYIDWIEVGTGVIKEYGMSIVREIRDKYPHHTLVADMKTCDAAFAESKQAFEAGADITTVMGFSDDNSIKEALKAGTQFEKNVMIDLLNIKNTQRYQELYNLGVKFVSVHIGKDQQSTQSLSQENFNLLNTLTDMKIAVAGGMSVDTIPGVLQAGAGTIIVGGAITKSENPKMAAAEIKEVLKNA